MVRLFALINDDDDDDDMPNADLSEMAKYLSSHAKVWMKVRIRCYNLI